MGYVQKENKRVNIVALLNIIIGIPVIIFSTFLLSKGFLADYLIIVCSCLSLLAMGLFYSVYKVIKQYKDRKNSFS